MQTVEFNKTEISKLSLGTVQFGLDYGVSNKNGKPNINNVKQIVDYVLECGVNCFDTASAYGTSEEVLGEVLDTKGNYIISKLKTEDFLENLENNLNNSLQKLNTDSLFGLLLHDSKLIHKWKEEYSIAVNRLIDEKKISYFGVSIYTDEDFNAAIENSDIQFIQIPFNIFDQRAINLNWFEKAKQNNKLIFIRSIYLQGLLLMDSSELPDNLSGAKKYLDNLEEYSQKLNLTRNQLILSFVNNIAKESIILFGCDNKQQAMENIDNFNNSSVLDNRMLKEISEKFLDIPEVIYNPTKW